MKVLDLLNKIANGEEVPKKIKFQNVIYEYDRNRKEYIHEIKEFCSETLLFNVMYCHFINEILEAEVEVIEDEEIDIQELEEIITLEKWKEQEDKDEIQYFDYIVKHINKNMQAIKQIDKKLKEKK